MGHCSHFSELCNEWKILVFHRYKRFSKILVWEILFFMLMMVAPLFWVLIDFNVGGSLNKRIILVLYRHQEFQFQLLGHPLSLHQIISGWTLPPLAAFL
jgi:hypothetical protein